LRYIVFLEAGAEFNGHLRELVDLGEDLLDGGALAEEVEVFGEVLGVVDAGEVLVQFALEGLIAVGQSVVEVAEEEEDVEEEVVADDGLARGAQQLEDVREADHLVELVELLLDVAAAAHDDLGGLLLLVVDRLELALVPELVRNLKWSSLK